MRVFVTGGTGFIGRHAMAELARRGYEVVGLTRAPGASLPDGAGENSATLSASIRWIVGDLEDPSTYRHGLVGCEAVLHLAWTGWRGEPHTTESLLAAAREAGVPRFIYMSCLGVGGEEIAPAGESIRLLQRKGAVEDVISRAPAMQRTIVRSSLVFGPGDRFVTSFGYWLRRMPVVPEPMGHPLRAQPIYVDDVAAALCNLLERRQEAAAPLRIVEAGGPDVLTLADLLDLIGAAMGRMIKRVPVPWRVGTTFFFGSQRLGLGRINPAVLPMMMSGASCATDRFLEDAHLPGLLPFGPGIRRYMPAI